ncbi:MAG: creatininase family protein [Hyphomicrobiaceae bacterium]
MTSSKPSGPSPMWKELTAPELRDLASRDATVILPVASMEQHGPHLAVGVDTILCESVCRLAAEAVRAEMPVVVAPTLWCGLAEHHMAFGGTFTFDLPTYRAVLLAFLKSIARHGFAKVLIVNGHGGNISALSAFMPDFTLETGLKLCATTYFELVQPEIDPILEDQERVRHACEGETSLMMYLAPNEVRHDKLPEAHGARHSTPRPLGVARHRSFQSFSKSGVVGDARKASRDKGERLAAVCRDGIVAVLKDPEAWS